MAKNWPPKDSTVIYMRGVNRALKDLFRVYCVRRGVSMTRAFTEYMKECVRKETK